MGVTALIMNKSLKNLINHQSVIETLRTLVGMWSSMDTEPQYLMIGHLVDNKNLLQHFCNDIVYFKNDMNVRMNAKEKTISDESEIGRNYFTEIVERLQFLEYIDKHYN